MRPPSRGRLLLALWAMLAACALNAGCITVHVPAGNTCQTATVAPPEEAPASCGLGGCVGGRLGLGLCKHHCGAEAGEDDCPLPKELRKVSLPDYIVEPPDILYITQVRG